MLGEDALRRAFADRGGFTTAIPADRWGESVAYAVIAPITSTGSDRGVLCALRHSVPFDAVEVVAGEAAARLLSMAFADAQASALAAREAAPARPAPGQESAAAAASAHAGVALRVAIVEAEPATRLGLEAILGRARFVIACSSATVAEAIAQLAWARCDVALVGTAADAGSADAVERLRARSHLDVVLMTRAARGADARASLRAGASGHLPRDAAPAAIVAALHAAAAGVAAVDLPLLRALLLEDEAGDEAGGPDAQVGPVAGRGAAVEPVSGRGAAVEPAAAETAEGAPAEAPKAPRRPADVLSPRELELLRYLAEGYTNKEIARVMVLADDTVKKGVQSLIAKLGATDRTHAVVLALRSGVIE